jgi:hypothetical protein
MTLNDASNNITKIDNTKIDTIKIDNINDIFKLPIFYQDKKSQLKDNIIADLELIKTIDTDASGCIPILHSKFQPANCLAKKTLEQIPTYSRAKAEEKVKAKQPRHFLFDYIDKYRKKVLEKNQRECPPPCPPP